MNALYTIRRIRDFNVFSWVRFKSRRLRKVMMERPAVPPTVRRWVTAGFPVKGIGQERDIDRSAERRHRAFRVLKQVIAVDHRRWFSIQRPEQIK